MTPELCPRNSRREDTFCPVGGWSGAEILVSSIMRAPCKSQPIADTKQIGYLISIKDDLGKMTERQSHPPSRRVSYPACSVRTMLPRRERFCLVAEKSPA